MNQQPQFHPPPPPKYVSMISDGCPAITATMERARNGEVGAHLSHIGYIGSNRKQKKSTPI